tara:strand:+ start:2573 stop:3100 length:528 start_codon:yes stop_codon:yes gene_type:complete
MADDNNFDFTPKDNQGQKQRTVQIPTEALNNLEVLDMEVVPNISETELSMGRNSRCVSVDTFSFAPEGRKEKKRVFKGKGDLVKFRCTVYEKKLLNVKAKRAGLSLSEYVRRTVFEQDITERFTDEHIEIYKMLIKYHNNFKSIGNMFKKRNPKLMEEVHALANDIKEHLKKFQS